MNSIMQNQ